MRVAILTYERVVGGIIGHSGFAARYGLLAKTLAQQGDDVLVIEFGAGRGDDPSARLSLPNMSFAHELVDSNTQPGSGAGRRLWRMTRPASLAFGSARGAAPWERQISDALTAWRPDVVLVATPVRPETLLLAPRGTVKVFFAEEDLSSYVTRSRPRSALFRALCALPRSVVIISSAESAWAERTFRRAAVCVVPHAVDLEYWQPVHRAEPRWDALAVGDFSQERNYQGLVEVCRLLSRKAEGERVALASARPLPPSAREAVAGIVRDLGPVEDVRGLYAEARTVLVPAFKVTGVKTQVLQGWAMERPVITTTAAAASTGAENGIHLLAGATPSAVAGNLQEVLEDQGLSTKLVEAGRTVLRAMHSPEVAAASLAAAINAAKARGRGV